MVRGLLVNDTFRCIRYSQQAVSRVLEQRAGKSVKIHFPPLNCTWLQAARGARETGETFSCRMNCPQKLFEVAGELEVDVF